MSQFNLKEQTAIIKPYKQNGDKTLPKKKDELVKLYHKWKDRPPLKFDHSSVNDFFASMRNHNNDNAATNNEDFIEVLYDF